MSFSPLPEPRSAPPAPAAGARTRLFDVLDHARPRERPCLSVWNGGGFDELSWDDWRRMIERATRGVRDLGVQPRQPVSCVLTNTSAVCAGAFAVWLAGGTIASLPTPARGMSSQSYLGQLRRILRRVGSDVLLVEQAAAAALPTEELPGIRIVAFESLIDSGRVEPDLPARDDVIFIQYSSGSTGEPRGCMLQARAIEAQVDILAEGLGLDPAHDQGVMWLPLSHDMGLFGCLMMSFITGVPLLVSRPERFLRSPRSWLEDCAAVNATVTSAPNFALELAARAAAVSQPPRFPLQKCIIGGERVEAATLARLEAALGVSGVTAEALVPAYGLAEAVLAVTMKELGTRPRTIAADAEALLHGRVELREEAQRHPAELRQQAHANGSPGNVRQLVSAGRPLRGVEIAIRGGEVGEICVSTPTLAAGYAGEPGVTAQRFVDGEIHTRDIGFMLDGELFINGRVDDMINLGGRNIWARDIELAICSAAPVKPGSCALVDVADGNRRRLVLIAEPTSSAGDLRDLARSASQIAYATSGVAVDECLLVAPGTVPKTPSGKIQRYRCRALATAEDLEPLLRTAC